MGVLGRHFRIHVLRYMYSKGLLGATVVQTKIIERANVPVFLSGLGDEIPARTLTWGYLVIASAMVMERALRFVPASCFRICVAFLDPSARCAQFTRQFVPAHLFSPDEGESLSLQAMNADDHPRRVNHPAGRLPSSWCRRLGTYRPI